MATKHEQRPHLISRAEFARRAERSRSTITDACKGPLAKACRGPRVDAAHPTVVAWARERGIDPAQLVRVPSWGEMAERARAKNGVPRPAKLEHLLWQLTIDGEPIIGTLAEVLDAAAERSRRLAPHVDGAFRALIDLDHPAVLKFMSECLGRPCTPDDLDEVWTAARANAERARERDAAAVAAALAALEVGG